MTYFNTTNQTGKVLNEYNLKADGQTKLILEIYRTMNKPLAPHQVHAMMPDNWQLPVTSVRRSITCLTPKFLRKSARKTMGTFGREVHTWELV